MPDAQAQLSLTLDGREIPAHQGEKLIAAAERAGTYIPRFCYHPRLRPVGMCRMCLVEVKGPRGYSLQPACFIDAADGMEVLTASPKVRKAQDGVLELLLANHPLDCPVCDRGGECPLQDQTLAYGPGESRFIEEKRHWPKPIPISPLIWLDRERCIQCDRCTRFAQDLAGEPLINFMGRGDQVEVNTFPGRPFSSHVSANIVQICPVGALTAAPYRFKARPWDLSQVESTCTTCSVGCRVAVQSSANTVIRYLGIDCEPVNQSWLCDKGRFDFEALASPRRLTQPLLKRAEALVPATWPEALAAAARGLGEVAKLHGPNSVALIGGARLANEDAYAWAKLAKGIIGTDSTDAQLGDSLPAEVILGLPRATIEQACSAPTVLLLGPDIAEELPVLWLRLRAAVTTGKLALVEIAPAPSTLTPLAAASLAYRPGEAASVVRHLLGQIVPRPSPPSAPTNAGGPPAGDGALGRARDLCGVGASPAGEGLVIAFGRPSLAESAAGITAAIAELAEALPGARWLSLARRANVHGALEMGLAPGLLPGRVSLEAGRERFERAWGRLPAERGTDTEASLRGAAAGEPTALVLLGADPLGDFPDRRLAERALDQAAFVLAVESLPNASTAHADVVLPVAMYAERGGSTTNLEGRVSRLARRVVPPGGVMEDWMVASELAAAFGSDLGLESLEQITDEIAALAPSHAGLTATVLASPGAADGLVVPLAATPVSLARRPAQLDPTATPGLASAALGADPAPPPAPLYVSGHGGLANEGNISPLPMLRFEGSEPAPELPRTDAYGLRLVAGRRLYDLGTQVQCCPSMAGLAEPAQLRVNPYDLDRLGKATGDRVRVHTQRAAAEVAVRADAGVARGTAVIGFNCATGSGGDGGAAGLIDAGAAVVDVRVESA